MNVENSTNGLTSDIGQQIADKLMALLQDAFEEGEIYDAIKPIIPAIVKLGVTQGFDIAKETLEGLATEDDIYPYWQTLLGASTAEGRIELMEEARQAAVRNNIKKIERDQEQWNVLLIVLKALADILPLLL